MRPLLAIAAVILAIAAGVSPAFGYPAAATTALNVRSGAGTQFDSIGVLQRGQVVDVHECAGNWCLVEDGGLRGWASARYLEALEEEAAPESPAPAVPAAEPNVTVTIETPDFTFAVGHGDRPGYRPPSSGQVCFFDRDNFRGRRFCAGSGDEDRYLAPGWNDAVRSVRVEGEAEVTVCTDVELAGECLTLSGSAPLLDTLAGRISSYRVSAF